MKVRLAASVAIPKAVWGSCFSVKLMRQILPLVKAVCGGQHICASTELFYMLAGHGLHAEFCAAFQAYSFLGQIVRRHPRAWPRRSPNGSWLGSVRAWLADLGWQETGPWLWHHPNLGPQGFNISWTARLTQPEIDRENHQLRESWRRQLFAKFLASARRDAAAVQGSSYSERRVANVRKVFSEQDAHGKGVMLGGVVSDARLDRMRREEIQPCQWCEEGAIPSWSHAAWTCAGFESTRPSLPSDHLQKVLGWPLGNTEYNHAILAHLSTVRKRLLDRRYRAL